MGMGGKRKRDEGGESGGGGAAAEEEVRQVNPQRKQVLPSSIKNKDKRAAVHSKIKHEKKLEKRKKQKDREAKEKKAMDLGEELPPRPVPHTIENQRVPDETICLPDDDELFAGNDADEFSGVLKREFTPKILITTCRFNSTRGPAFISELLTVIPNAHYFKRGTYDLKQIVKYANKKEFTSIVVVHTNRREPDALLIIGLPEGPTAHFKLSSLVLRKDIKNHGNPTRHMPELVMNNFTTRLGHRVGRMIQSLFPQDPNFRGRRVVTFHNQRDFIFFRHHRYIFDQKEIKPLDGKGKNKETKEKVAIDETTTFKKPVIIIVVKMAVSGKTTFMNRLVYHTRGSGIRGYVVSLDPAVMTLPYGANIDIRDTVKYKEVMKQYNLGPNGEILTSLNLFATKFDEVVSVIEKRAEQLDYVLVDISGQIEILT